MADVQLRPMRADDVSAGLRLCRHAGWNQEAADWQLFLSASPDGCRVAVTGAGDIVGSAATICYEDRFSWVGMVLVDPAHRRAGIGRRLLEEAIAILDGIPAIRLDATPAGTRIYRPLNFHEEYRLQRMQREAGPATVATDHGVRRTTAADVDAITTHDSTVFGADRRCVLETFYRRAPEYAWVADDGPTIGYVFGRHGHAFEHIGPLVATSDHAAGCLVAACLSMCGDRPFIIDVPLVDSWMSSLVSMQFTAQRPFIRMRRGVLVCPERRDQIMAIAGPEFG